MLRKCKDIDITDVKFCYMAIQRWKDHRTQKEMNRDCVKELYASYGNNQWNIARELSKEIKERKLKLKPVTIAEKIDTSNGKHRIVSIESPKQQMFNYIAILGLTPLLGYIGQYQCTCVPGRGTIWGMQQIMKWNKNPNNRYVWQGDVIHNYQSITADKMEKCLRRRIANENLIWLNITLIKTNPLDGLPLGSALSVYQDALFMAQAYHYIEQQMYKQRRGKRVNLVKHTLFFVDDIAMYCSSYKDASKAQKLLRKYMKTIGLQLHEKSVITKITQTQYQDILGFRIYRDHVTMRRRDYLKLKSALRQVDKDINIKCARRLVSMNGFIKYSDSFRFRKKYHTKRLMKKARRYISDYEKGKIPKKTKSCNIHGSRW